MLSVLAVVVSLALLMWLAYRGVTVLLLAPLMGALAVLLSGPLALPMLALTAFATTEDRVREAGFDAYLAKPADPPSLVRAIAALAERLDRLPVLRCLLGRQRMSRLPPRRPGAPPLTWCCPAGACPAACG